MSAAVAKDDAATDDEEATPDVAEADPVATQEALIKLIDANDFDAFAERLAADASIKNLAGGGGAGAAGRDKVVAQVKAVGGKLKGRLNDVNAARTGPRTARAVATVKAFGMTVRVFFEFEFARGGEVVGVGLGKDVGDADAFLAPPADDDAADSAGPAPPYLVPRPAVFPPPTVVVSNARVVGVIASPYKIKLRPLHPYLKVALQGSPDGAARTTVQYKCATPDWRAEAPTARGAEDTAKDALELIIMDHNRVGKNQWLARATLALADVAPCAAPAAVQVPLAVRTSVESQDSKPADAADAPRLAFDLQVFDCERWWLAQELAARDAAEETAAPKKRWFRTFFGEQ